MTHIYDTPQAQCWPHRYSRVYELHPTCLDCGGQKCNAPDCQHLAWEPSEGGWCPAHEINGCLDETRRTLATRDAEASLEAWLWYQAALAGIAPSGGSWRDRRDSDASPEFEAAMRVYNPDINRSSILPYPTAIQEKE